jgi:hypothetical protein
MIEIFQSIEIKVKILFFLPFLAFSGKFVAIFSHLFLNFDVTAGSQNFDQNSTNLTFKVEIQ